MKSILHTLLALFILTLSNQAFSQATVSYPFSVGKTTTCGTGGSHEVHFYTYNAATNTIANATGGLLNACTPQLRIGSPANGTQQFTSIYSSVSFNPRDKNIYFFWTATSGALAPGGIPRTYAWRWPAGTCPGTASNKLDTIRSFPADLLGVAFDNSGNGYIIEFTNPLPTSPPTYKPLLRSIDFATGALGVADTLNLTGGAQIYQQGSGDVAISPSGQMFFVVDNKLFTPNYQSYTGTASNLTCTYVDTVKLTGNFVGLTYADGETIAAYSGGGCPYYEIDPLTAVSSNITKSGSVKSSSDLAAIISGIGAAKKLVSVIPTGTAKQYDVVYDILVKNYGNTDITNVQVTDNLSSINGVFNFSNVSVSLIGAPPGITANPSYNGGTLFFSNINLLNGTGTLPNYPVASSSFIIRVSVRLSNINPGVVYNNSATATATGYNSVSLTDVSTNGSKPDLNTNDKPDDVGENQPTPLLITVTNQTSPCASLTKILYTQNFGTGTGLTTSVAGATGGTGVTGVTGTTSYTGSTTQPIPLETYTISNNANNGNTSRWINLTDHTGNPNGRMMLFNADAASTLMYRGGFTYPICEGMQYSITFYAAFLANPAYQTVCGGFGGSVYPDIKIRIIDGTSGLIITEANTGDIMNTGWQQFGLKFKTPLGFSYTSLKFELINDAPGGCGNDVAIDDIIFGSCDPLPIVTFNNSNAGCLGSSVTFSANLSDPGAIFSGTPAYQWETSPTGGAPWTIVGTSSSYNIASTTAGDVNKYYRVWVAATSGSIGSSCSYVSPSYLLVAGCDIDDDDDGIPDTVECGGVDPDNDDDGDGIANYRDTDFPGFVDINNDGINDNFDADLDGIINSLDLDSDNDGIPDVVEAGGVDANGDGKIDNYTDTDLDGFSQNVDANNTGATGSGNGLGAIDTDGDGIPNFLDLDSDNDGIPDVVEAYGTDANNDGRVDGFVDANGNGFSDNEEGNVNALLKTGADINNDGRADSYPNKNMDADSKPNPYDLDSDGDGITDVKEAQFTDANWDGQVDGAINANGRNTALAALGTLTIPNTDGTGRANVYDIDSDDDGIPDNIEGQTTLGYAIPSGSDSDGDGIDNSYDNYAGFGGDGVHFPNTDADAQPDYLDDDTDGDGLIDRIEGNDFNLNGNPDDLVTLTGVDTDGDGLDNRFDNNNASAKGTSAYMGNGGIVTGDATPGSTTMVQHTAMAFGCATERDWRCLPYVLSCEFVTFQGSINQQQVPLQWTALCKQEVDYFIVERSTDREHFTEVLREQGNPKLNEIQAYSATDNIAGQTANVFYYRLRSVMKTGKEILSDIITIKRNGGINATVKVMPNPVKDRLQLAITSPVNQQATIYILDGAGRIIQSVKQQLVKGQNLLTYTEVGTLAEGVYYIKLTINDQVLTDKFSKVK